MGKSTISIAIFNSFLLVYQRVTHRAVQLRNSFFVRPVHPHVQKEFQRGKGIACATVTAKWDVWGPTKWLVHSGGSIVMGVPSGNLY